MTLSDSMADIGFGVGWSVIKGLPEPAANRLFQAIAERTWRGQGQSVLQLKANLSRVLGPERIDELDDVAHEGVRRYMRYWCEVFRMPAWSRERLGTSFRLTAGLDGLDRAVDAGNGVIVVSPHMGNWDLAAGWASQRYGSVVTVAERLRPESLFDKFVAYRESLGMEVFPLGDPATLRGLARRLKEGKLVCLLADRDISHTGVPVTFFGERASMPGGPALLSLMTGAPIMHVTDWHTDSGADAMVGPPIPMPESGTRAERIAEITQTIADGFAQSIAAHPEDWHMMQPLWSVDLGERR